MAKKISRRKFLKYSGLAGAGILGVPALQGLSRGPGRAWAATKPIKIGGIYSLSGVVAAWGQADRRHLFPLGCRCRLGTSSETGFNVGGLGDQRGWRNTREKG
jgi:hypothetical protein